MNIITANVIGTHIEEMNKAKQAFCEHFKDCFRVMKEPTFSCEKLQHFMDEAIHFAQVCQEEVREKDFVKHPAAFSNFVLFLNKEGKAHTKTIEKYESKCKALQQFMEEESSKLESGSLIALVNARDSLYISRMLGDLYSFFHAYHSVSYFVYLYLTKVEKLLLSKTQPS